MMGEGLATNPEPCSVWITGIPTMWAARSPTRLMGKKRVCVPTMSIRFSRRNRAMRRVVPTRGKLMTSAMGR